MEMTEQEERKMKIKIAKGNAKILVQLRRPLL